ncbi:MAG: iron-containing alcohol dehydrogenase [Oscillospiraceae bacterium]|nr:iron-containing alcohol dehydrogenase [Candidatus Equicaccousia limihippi]
MNQIMEIIEDFKKPCYCGLDHQTAIKDVVVEYDALKKTGEILKRNGFSKNLLLVADKNTLKAADGISDVLKDFTVTQKIYDDLRLATMEEVESVENIIKDKDISVISVGTGSLNDTCRLACARQDKLLCIFATAPSMDGFASYGAPIVKNGFKLSYDAKSPEVIIGDTKILAAAPAPLKAAGFGDMMAKYVGLADWKISSILTGEIYCEMVAALTRTAADNLILMADKVQQNDPDTAGEIFTSLLLTGIGMSFMKNSRPASGSEHIIAHLIECLELRENKLPNLHGEDVGVATLYMLNYLQKAAQNRTVKAHKENLDLDNILEFYGNMAPQVKELNTPTTILSDINPQDIEEKWQDIRDAILELPKTEKVLDAMKKAGCKISVEDIEKPQKLFEDAVKYSPYMRRRLTLLRLGDMIEYENNPL